MKDSKMTGKSTLSHGDIAKRAYELYLAKGRKNGNEKEDWLKAEAELRQAQNIQLNNKNAPEKTTKVPKKSVSNHTGRALEAKR
ncbi:DUF2934 domain-containing protein [Bdellovibrionota bacterium FG-1]